MADEILQRLVRIETKLDGILREGRDHETRLRSVEKWRWLIVGGGAVVIFLVQFVPSLIHGR
jgi:hypothetical protein